MSDPKETAVERMTDEEFESAVQEGRTSDSGLDKVEAEARRAREAEANPCAEHPDSIRACWACVARTIQALKDERDAALKRAEEAERYYRSAHASLMEDNREQVAELRAKVERLTGALKGGREIHGVRAEVRSARTRRRCAKALPCSGYCSRRPPRRARRGTGWDDLRPSLSVDDLWKAVQDEIRKEREACATLADEIFERCGDSSVPGDYYSGSEAAEVAAAIRAREEK